MHTWTPVEIRMDVMEPDLRKVWSCVVDSIIFKIRDQTTYAIGDNVKFEIRAQIDEVLK